MTETNETKQVDLDIKSIFEEDKKPSLAQEEMLAAIIQSLTTLEMISQTFGERLSQVEMYITYLLSKDPYMKNRIQEIAKITQEQENVETLSK
jgi:hypothetical protein